MRRLYKILLIIIIGIIFAIIIYFITTSDKENLLALGDGIASGQTAYNIDGLSYNDYLKESLEKKHHLEYYNNNFAKTNYKLYELINDLKNNKKDNKYLKQLVNDATIITISIGMDEIAKYSLTDKITEEYIKHFIQDYDNLIYMIRHINHNKIFIIGLYKANNITNKDLIIINSNLKDIANKYNAEYIEISNMFKGPKYYLKNNSFYFNYKGHYEIFEMLNYSISTCQN